MTRKFYTCLLIIGFVCFGHQSGWASWNPDDFDSQEKRLAQASRHISTETHLPRYKLLETWLHKGFQREGLPMVFCDKGYKTSALRQKLALKVLNYKPENEGDPTKQQLWNDFEQCLAFACVVYKGEAEEPEESQPTTTEILLSQFVQEVTGSSY